MLFEWDENKNRRNQIKHGIGFQTASYVFGDEFLLSEIDDRYAYYEERWKTTGLVAYDLICVAHTLENIDEEEIIRIISARAASTRETRRYRIHRGHARGITSIKTS